MQSHIASFGRRFSVLLDKSALVLIIPALVIVYFIDRAMATTLIQWLVFAPVLAGVAIHISRIVFPQVQLTKFINSALEGNTAAGIVSGAIILFVAFVVLALVLWAKA